MTVYEVVGYIDGVDSPYFLGIYATKKEAKKAKLYYKKIEREYDQVEIEKVLVCKKFDACSTICKDKE